MLTFPKVFLAFALAGGFATAASGGANVKATVPLNNAEIYRLYGQNSWIWKAGAGHFSVRARQFTAWSREEGHPSYGVGRWFITEPGKLCFNARWYAQSGSAPAITCFSHRKKGNVIYQKREPDGQWYIFRNAPVNAADEVNKLRYGDYVGVQLSKIQAIVSKAR